MSGPEGELRILTELVRRSAPDSEARPPGELRAIERAWRRRRQNRALGAVAGTALAAGVAMFAVLSWNAAAPLTFAVDGDVTWADRRVDVHDGRGARLSFSDGTRFALAAGTRAEIADVDGRGALLRLAAGRAHAAVVHRAGARWAVEAGPFVVRVVGTVFDVNWSARARVLEVALVEGEVKVDGPLPQLPIAVRAGQRLVLDATDGQLRVSPLGPARASRAVVAQPSASGGDVPAPAVGSPPSPGVGVALQPPTLASRPAVALAVASPRPGVVASPGRRSNGRGAQAAIMGSAGAGAPLSLAPATLPSVPPAPAAAPPPALPVAKAGVCLL
jgi:hypothetical protein